MCLILFVVFAVRCSMCCVALLCMLVHPTAPPGVLACFMPPMLVMRSFFVCVCVVCVCVLLCLFVRLLLFVFCVGLMLCLCVCLLCLFLVCHVDLFCVVV